MIANAHLALFIACVALIALFQAISAEKGPPSVPTGVENRRYVQMDLYQGLDLALANKIKIIAIGG